MLIKTEKQLPSSEITDPQVFAGRRDALRLLGSLVAAGLVGSAEAGIGDPESGTRSETPAENPYRAATPEKFVSRYNNYYEVAFDKSGPEDLAQNIATDPWAVEVAGLVENPVKFSMDDLYRDYPERDCLYRLRCVEAWSAVVPWLGFPLSDLLKKAMPLSSAKFVKFTSVTQPENMPNQRRQLMLSWPYVEGLRIDEAMHPLTILATGMYGKRLLKQSGAPLRLVVPWKYGFKSVKAVVKIELVQAMPLTTWGRAAPGEYGFYANVNPGVPHPRWSQATERPLGSRFFTPRRHTELFNGYGDQVAHMYSGMDLRRFF
jgi:sulfoxide reductase catalytic subunit YedY